MTNAKLHALVNSATVTGISNSEIASDAAIASSKLADIAGSKLTTLTTIAAGAGVIPAANLTSVAQKGSNSDITALTGLSTPISVAQGGTGTTAAANAANGVVVLNASAQLPAVSGALLTGLSAVPSGCILLWSGSIATIPTGYVLCNGANSTPDLRNRFVMAAGDTYAVDATGDGSIPAHIHTVSVGNSVGSGAAGGPQAVSSTINTSSFGTGTQNIAVYYALAYIMKT